MGYASVEVSVSLVASKFDAIYPAMDSRLILVQARVGAGATALMQFAVDPAENIAPQ